MNNLRISTKLMVAFAAMIVVLTASSTVLFFSVQKMGAAADASINSMVMSKRTAAEDLAAANRAERQIGAENAAPVANENVGYNPDLGGYAKGEAYAQEPGTTTPGMDRDPYTGESYAQKPGTPVTSVGKSNSIIERMKRKAKSWLDTATKQ